MDKEPIAYFSMEIALEEGIPTYSGGLGILAGDMLRSAADLKIPLCAITLLYRKGYFYQKLNSQGVQSEMPVEWIPSDFLQELPQRIEVSIEGRKIQVRAWQYDIKGKDGSTIPVYILDTDLPENSAWDRTLNHFLYGGDQYYRFCQEIVLGIGGVRMLRALGYDHINRFHMNEGHASLLTLELLDEAAKKAKKEIFTHEEVELVRKQCVFTTHTPVIAGHDKFPQEMVEKVLQRKEIFKMKEVFCCEGVLNMTYLALNLSHYVNGVAKRHGEVSRLMFSKYSIDSITNGVYAPTWVSPSFQELYNQHIPGWKEDNFSLRSALSIPKSEIWNGHFIQKKMLIEYVNRKTNEGLDFEVFTIGFARRSATYKRGDLLFHDINRLKELVSKAGPIQIIYAGKAHPQDQPGKDIIKFIFQAKEQLRGFIKVVYLENYDIEMAQKMISGVDIWLNTPQTPMEASGTSGMKAALNGVPMLSTLDGWWIEGCIEGITGWSIGSDSQSINGKDKIDDAISLFDQLENVIIPMFYHERDAFINVMTHCIALNGSFFNTQRMVLQYLLKAYYR
ncbi:MAG: alpha-glucan family phosphorylase [Parachlamydiaceae bacterium]|nr:alpha-glucan family phosphorylase [Parachlamydiaceae bacterium]